MQTFFYPRLMFSFGTSQVGVGDANLTKTQIQAPLFDAGAEYLDRIIVGVVHG